MSACDWIRSYLARWSCSQSIKCIRCIAPNMRITCTPGLDYERHSKGEHFIGKTLQWFKVSEPTLHCVLTSHTDKLISGVWYLVAFLSVSIFRLKKKSKWKPTDLALCVRLRREGISRLEIDGLLGVAMQMCCVYNDFILFSRFISDIKLPVLPVVWSRTLKYYPMVMKRRWKLPSSRVFCFGKMFL